MNRLARTLNPLASHVPSKNAAAKTNGNIQDAAAAQLGNGIISSDSATADDSDIYYTTATMQRLADRDAPREQKHWSMPSAMDSPALGTSNDTHGLGPVSSPPQQSHHQQQQQQPVLLNGGRSSGTRAISGPGLPGPDGFQESPPDILSRAFNEALQPYQERIRRLEGEIARVHATLSTLEHEKAAVHNWIDRRGLRPDLPADLAGYFAASPVAAGTLAAQLERKMTMLNYNLHQLGDVLPTPPPASTITSALAALLPTIQQLAALPGGPAGAFEALIKLAGNLNSHGTGDESDADRSAIASFYADLDDAMVRVVGLRAAAATEGIEDWDISRDLERLQRTGAFLKKEMGVRNYFVRAQEAMRGDPSSAAPTSIQRNRLSSQGRPGGAAQGISDAARYSGDER